MDLSLLALQRALRGVCPRDRSAPLTPGLSVQTRGRIPERPTNRPFSNLLITLVHRMKWIDRYDGALISVFINEASSWSEALYHTPDSLFLAAHEPKQD